MTVFFDNPGSVNTRNDGPRRESRWPCTVSMVDVESAAADESRRKAI
jgi:hypothetical protein